jgi:hypothetical protein
MLLRVLFPKLTSRHNVSFGYNILIIRRYIIFFPHLSAVPEGLRGFNDGLNVMRIDAIRGERASIVDRLLPFPIQKVPSPDSSELAGNW